jgi:D-mannonate dehydratase
MKKTVRKKGAKKVAVRVKRVTKATEWEKKMAALRKASSAKIKELELELIRLREENEYMNRRLASKDMEMETYKKTMEEKVFQLQAKVKALGG